jgi:hypothetical protein
MSANTEFNPLALRVAHLHARLEWNADDAGVLTLMRRMHARGIFTVLVAPATGLLARNARQAGIRVIALETGIRARRQLARNLQEFHLSHLHAHDPEAAALGLRLRRRLAIPLVQPRPNPFARQQERKGGTNPQAQEHDDPESVIDETLAAYAAVAPA